MKCQIATVCIITGMACAGVTSSGWAKDDGLALRPPMGWNSYDAFGTEVTEEIILATAEVMAEKLKPYGYEYVVTDWYWYQDDEETRHTDRKGRYIPSPLKYPSGFKSLTDRIHAMGLKFGVHYRSDEMPRDPGFLKSVAKQLGEWGVDFVKYDFIGHDVERVAVMSKALKKSGRDIVLSLSFELPVDKARDWQKYAHMSRMTTDVWDNWKSILINFPIIRQWDAYRGPGHWPDCDMLPLGVLRDGRANLLTASEQRTMMTLWCIAQSPLMIGGDLRKLDEFTLALLTNEEVLEVNQQGLRVQSLEPFGVDEGKPYIGLDFGAGQERRIKSIRYSPMIGHEEGMLGGRFEGSTDGTNWNKFFSIVWKPASEKLAKKKIKDKTAYRYVRYVPEDGRDVRVAELEFISDAGIEYGKPIAGGAPPEGRLMQAFDGSIYSQCIIKPARPIDSLQDEQVWWNEMPDGSKAVGLFNLSTNVATLSVSPSEIGMSGPLAVRDLWKREDVGIVHGDFETEVGPHDAVFIRVKEQASETEGSE